MLLTSIMSLSTRAIVSYSVMFWKRTFSCMLCVNATYDTYPRVKLAEHVDKVYIANIQQLIIWDINPWHIPDLPSRFLHVLRLISVQCLVWDESDQILRGISFSKRPSQYQRSGEVDGIVENGHNGFPMQTLESSLVTVLGSGKDRGRQGGRTEEIGKHEAANDGHNQYLDGAGHCGRSSILGERGFREKPSLQDGGRQTRRGRAEQSRARQQQRGASLSKG